MISYTAPFGVVVSTNGQFVFVTNFGPDNVAVFTIGAAGVLSPTVPGTFNTGTNPQGIAVPGRP